MRMKAHAILSAVRAGMLDATLICEAHAVVHLVHLEHLDPLHMCCTILY